jgi:hypothetical protein
MMTTNFPVPDTKTEDWRSVSDSGTTHMSDIQQMFVAMQWLVDLISIVTNSTLLHNVTGAMTTMERNCDLIDSSPMYKA